MDRIVINGLRVMTLVGVLAHEREAPQPLQVGVRMQGAQRRLREAAAAVRFEAAARYATTSSSRSCGNCAYQAPTA